MKMMKKLGSRIMMMALAIVWMFSMSALADDYSASGDNSLYSLGLENAESIEPEFYYATLEYNVTVAAGTEELLLDPVKSADTATITDISGTSLDNGNGTVTITVEAESGVTATYTLHVTSEGSAETETEDAQKIAESEAAAESEKLAAQSESVAESERAAQLEQKAQQVTALQAENDDFANRIDILMKVLYGLVAFAVILLFVIINQSLRNKDLKDENKNLKGQVTESYEYARKEQNMRSDYYYAPVQNTPQQLAGNTMQMNDMSGNVQAAFGNASQRLQAQPLSKKELKKQEKEAKKAAKLAAKNGQMQEPMMDQPMMQGQPMMQQAQPMMQQAQQDMQQVQQGVQQAAQNVQQAAQTAEQQAQAVQQQAPTMVQSTIEEPDVNVDMIDL